MGFKAVPGACSIDLEVTANRVSHILFQKQFNVVHYYSTDRGTDVSFLKTMLTQQGFSVTGVHYFHKHHLSG